MRGILLRILINALALGTAAYFIDGIAYGSVGGLVIVAAMFGALNAFIKPILKFLTCPLQILTLGLFTLVLNGLLLWLTSWLANQLGLGFDVDGFIPAFLGALIVSAVSIVADFLIPD